MAESGRRVPENSATYREFVRLYDLARQLRPTGVDRWNRELYATSGIGGFDQQTGAIGIREPLLREGLTKDPASNARWQARALATVLNRATRAGMHVDAPGEANVVRTTQSRGLQDGVASVRAATDFHAFTRMAGYPNLAFNDQESGAYAAANELIRQTSGPSVDRQQLVDRLHQGPAMMHFDRLAEGVVRNRLAEVAPAEGVDRQAMRRELIGEMLHPQWDSLAQRSPEDGRRVAGEIGQALNAKVDEIRRRSPQTLQVAPSDGRQREAATKPRPGQESTARFLTGLAPAGGAAGQAPSLGDGSRAAAQHATAATRPRAPGESMRR
ncbi:hypothetical protein JOF29_002348 [Kribbella aluminosa]|uniref:Uncharacterized protein n=1 Tax=Kribbella aluminosa TaxID=416017 RepID=A0ABS4UI13_9ACTN|nr:hypothetical protein [Kribbella aluminosa]MBP2351265.1 hypothetical protein [Kribbella aluminosa]